MRIIRYRNQQGQETYGRQLEGGEVQPLAGDIFNDPQPAGSPEQPTELLAPLSPTNIFCIGLNYREHATESGMPFPDKPIVFMKPNTAVIAPGRPIVIPACCDPRGEVDYECELAVVIGKAARNVSAEDALQYVFGYTAANDVSARTWQKKGGGGQWIRGKGFDTFCPLGPAIVTADEIPDPQALRIRTVLNGETVQDHTTGDMIFSAAQIIAFLSQDTTLAAGTLILTGTPQGVGAARKPPLWLKAGDQVRVEVEGVGVLENPVQAAN